MRMPAHPSRRPETHLGVAIVSDNSTAGGSLLSRVVSCCNRDVGDFAVVSLVLMPVLVCQSTGRGLAPKAYKIMIGLGFSSMKKDFGVTETDAAGEANLGNLKESRRPCWH